jgi:formylglycine-generating enzyme required for sulfatase activity
LRQWIDANRENLRTRTRLKEDRTEWLKRNKDSELLGIPSLRLRDVQKLSEEPGDVRIDDIKDYIDALLDHDRHRKEAASARVERQQQKARRVRALAYVTLASIIAGLFSWINRLDIEDEINWWWFGRPYMLTYVQPLSSDDERAKKPGDAFRECKDCPEMAVIPQGEFTMGSPSDEKGHDPNEEPQHIVRIAKPFAVSKFDVTFAEWDACFSVGGCLHRPIDYGWGRDRRPVISVSWNDAKTYVAWLSKMTGKDYRLLTEAEWEYAARADTTTAYYWGDAIGKSNANCNGCGSEWDGRQTAPAGSFAPNGFGLYDMFGNVWDWVEDCFHNNYEGAPTDGSAWGGTAPVGSFAPPRLYDMFRKVWDWVEDYFHNNYEGAPTDGSARTARACYDRVVRSGSWDDQPQDVRAADRYRYSPGVVDSHVGFRVARTLTP